MILLTAALMTGTIFFIFAVYPFGIGISEDTVSYLSAAESLHDSGKMLGIDGNPMTAWTPLFPLLIYLLKLLPVRIENSLLVFNLITFLLTLWTSWLLIRLVIHSFFFRCVTMTALVFSFTLLQVFTTALSESLFLLLINLFLLICLKINEAEQKENKRYLLLLFFTLLATAMLQRFAGIFLIPVAVVILYYNKYHRTVFNTGLLFISGFPLAFWLFRNWKVTGTLTGLRPAGNELFEKNIMVLSDTITSWFLPIQLPISLRLFAGSLLILFILFYLFQHQSKSVFLLCITTVSYISILCIAYWFTSFEEPRDRLLSPVFIPLFILLFSGLDFFTQKLNLKKIIIPLVLLWLFYPAARTLKHLHRWHDEGVEVYNHVMWKDNEMLSYLKENELSGKIISNDAHAIYFFTGLHATPVPKSIYHDVDILNEIKAGSYIVWWEGDRYSLHNFNTFKNNFELMEVKRMKEGVIYRITLNRINGYF